MMWRFLPWAALLTVLLTPFRSVAFDPLATSHTYDYVILTDDSLVSQADRLAAHRAARFRVCRVKMSEVRASFSGADDTAKLRSFVLYAYQNWRVAPTHLLLMGDANMTNQAYNRVPTYLRWNEYYEWHDNRWFADDVYYVESPFSGDEKPIMYVGRIPARTVAQAACAVDKILAYDGITGNPVWLHNVLMLVGDADIGVQNDVYKTLNDQLQDEELDQWDSVRTLYSSDYDDDMQQWPENATEATRLAWNSGSAFVNAFGNTMGWTYLVYMAYFNLLPGGTADPTFTESLAGTERLPVLFAGTCLMNYFYRDYDLCVGEDLLLSSSDRGAVAVVAATHANEAIESFEIDRYFVHELFHHGVKNLGRLFTAARTNFLTQELGHETFGKQVNLLGDPGLDLKVYPLPGPSGFVDGAEIEEAPVLQDVVLEKSPEGISNENLRVVHSDGGVGPMLGERMIRSKLTDGTGAPYIEWKLQDLNLPIEENTTLSFWINIVESPGGADKIVVDGNTTMGRLKDNFNIFDQNGVMLNAKYRAPMPAGWQFVYADLSPLQGDSLLDIRLRYETTVAGEAGNLTAYLDDIRVEHHEGGEALNSSFEEDHDENGTPDFWTDIWGATETEGVLRSDDFAHEGSYSMLVYDGWCNGLGAQHIFHSNADIQVYGVAFQYMAPVPTSFRVRVIDANWEQELLNTTVAAGPAWTRFYGEFPNCDYGFGTGRVKIQILPQECEYPVYVDEMDIREWEGIGVRSVDPTPTVSRFASVSPNPAPRGSTLSVRFELTRASDVKVNVYDVAGRVAWEMPSREYPAGPQELIWSTQAQRLASGVYFLEMWVGGKRLSGTKKVVLLR